MTDTTLLDDLNEMHEWAMEGVHPSVIIRWLDQIPDSKFSNILTREACRRSVRQAVQVRLNSLLAAALENEEWLNDFDQVLADRERQ